MLKKLLITLKYGEQKARVLVSVIFVLVLGGAGMLTLGIITHSMVLLVTGAVLAIIGLLLLFSFSFVDIDVNMEKKAQNKRKGIKDGFEEKPEVERVEKAPTPEMPVELDLSMFDDDLSDVAIGVGGMSLSGLGGESSGSNDDDRDEDFDDEDGKSKKKDKKKKSKKYDIGESDDEDFDDEDDEEKLYRVKGSQEYEVKKPTPKQIKARKKMLKVRKDDRRFTPIIIDVWKDVSAMRVPAFVQDKGKTANIVLVEGALRTELMPMSEFLEVTYQKNVEERFMEQYDEIKNDADVSGIFGELIPAFYQGSGRGDSENMCKNLYVLGGKMAITTRSLRKLFNKFDFHFKVFDSLDLKGSYSDYFKAAYENRIFWTDNVITQNDYQDRIRTILQSMVEDPELVNYDFERDLGLMVRYNLITKEYADYYKARKNDKIRIRI